MKTPARIALTAGLGLLAATPALAAVEDVLPTLASAHGGGGVIERASGERWRLALGLGCGRCGRRWGGSATTAARSSPAG